MVSDILTYITCQSGGKNRGTRKQSYISERKCCSQICYLTLPTVITLYYNIMGRQAINKKHPLSAILFITLVTKILKIIHLLQSRKIMRIHELFLRQVTTAFF